MTRPERFLALLLRFEALVLFLAVPAALLPIDWMARIHAWLGLGEMPRSPLFDYLTRSLSLLYASWVPLLWLSATDVRRYRPLIEVMASTRAVLGGSLLVLDLVVGMPWFWQISEGPTIFVLSLIVLSLARRVQR